MPESPLQIAGAQIEPTSSAPLHTNEFFTGMWTQGNPLGPGAVPYLYQKFYSASRFDRLIGGQNVEVSSRLTLQRRPGHSVYNAGPFPPINRFYEFRTIENSQEKIHIMASCDAAAGSAQGTVRDVTAGTNLTLTTKGYAAGRTAFQSVGNILYFGDGSNTKKWVLSGKTWNATLVENISAIAQLIINPRTPSEQTLLVFTLTAPSQPLAVGTVVTPAGLTANPGYNGAPLIYISAYAGHLSSNQVAFPYPAGLPALVPGTETGTLDGTDSTYAIGDFIVDPNNNLQLSMGSQTAAITAIQVVRTAVPISLPPFFNYWYTVTIFLDPTSPIKIRNGVLLTLTGLTTVTWLNGQSVPVSPVSGSEVTYTILALSGANPAVAFSAETGSATTGTGVAGSAPPAWNVTTGQVTQDGTLQWVNMGSSVMEWGGPGPTSKPTVVQTPAPVIYAGWLANTWYAPKFVIIDSNGNLEDLTTGGTTGGGAPAWSVVVGGVTVDNTAQWTNRGTGAWLNAHAYVVGDIVVATYTYTITVPQQQQVWIQFPTGGGYWQWETVYVQQQITATSMFTCVIAGTSGTLHPAWTNGLNTTVTDRDVVWSNIGTPPAWPGAGAAISLITKIVDSNGNLQVAQEVGETGAVVPIWKTDMGATTVDGTQAWLNSGPFSPANQYAWIWAYSGKNTITGHISTASDLSDPLVVAAGKLAVITGPGLASAEWDTIVLWRTVQNGSILMYEDEFPNPGQGHSWVYSDTTQDPSSTASPRAGQLNFLITAPIDSANNAPPSGFIPQAYYLGRIFGYEGNVLRWSGGPDTITGSGNEAFPPLNQTTFPSRGVRCWATSIGLICYTLSDVWVLLGQGTSNSPFYVVNFQQGVGLGGQDAFCVNGSTAYGMLTSGQLVSMDPGAGELEVGFPIGDLLGQYDPTNAYLAWHQSSSADMALYAADGMNQWYRMAPVAAPEEGNVWSPAAIFGGGIKAIASLEIAPGIRRLLAASAVPLGGPILMRDADSTTDNGTTYPAYADIGSIVMAQPGGSVNVQFITTEEAAIANSSPVYVEVRFDEIAGTFEAIAQTSLDPPNLPQSQTVKMTRFWASQNLSICRHMQLRIGWLAEDFANELFTYTIYGRLPAKARK